MPRCPESGVTLLPGACDSNHFQNEPNIPPSTMTAINASIALTTQHITMSI